MVSKFTDGVRSQGLKMIPQLVVRFWSNKNGILFNSGVEVSNLMVRKITTPESGGVKSQGLRMTLE